MKVYTAYIDEAGDEGLGKLATSSTGGQSRWLVIGACLVPQESDVLLPTWRDAVIKRLGRTQTRDLHFRDLRHDQKIVVCQELAKRPLGAALTFSHKVTIPGSRHESVLKKKGYLYNYLTRWLLERVTAACRKHAGDDLCKLRIVFSRRSGTDYQTMREYLQLMRYGREVMRSRRSINWDVLDIDLIRVENHSKWAGLQFADCITSAFYSAVEPNRYGNYEHSYASILRPRLIKSNGVILDAGVTPVPRLDDQLDETQRAFFESFAK